MWTTLTTLIGLGVIFGNGLLVWSVWQGRRATLPAEPANPEAGRSGPSDSKTSQPAVAASRSARRKPARCGGIARRLGSMQRSVPRSLRSRWSAVRSVLVGRDTGLRLTR
jgi:hypothetical protein